MTRSKARWIPNYSTTLRPQGRKISKKAVPAKPHEVFARVSLARVGHAQALKKLKQSVDKVSKDLKEVDSVSEKLLRKGWPPTLAQHLKQSAAEVAQHANDNKDYWAQESIRDQDPLPLELTGKEPKLNSDQLREIERAITAINEKTKEFVDKKRDLDAKLRAFVTGVLADSVKIS